MKRKIDCKVSDIVENFKKTIIPFLNHRGRLLHQYKQLQYLKENLDVTEAVIHMDFSENYNMKYAQEIQSFHFGGSRQQISLHTVIVYTKIIHQRRDTETEMFLYFIRIAPT